MSVAAFIASQRTEHSVPHAVACRALGVSESWFHACRVWRAPTDNGRAPCHNAKISICFCRNPVPDRLYRRSA
ncbi:hypothetical protein GA0070608_5869 [Micromonospora peucetia]|uniref:Transposase n=1 Tax=Micromonospora peucetia TaxID=47871 RepID=A0A1C6W4W6_9ACTN|nr:hypothetical protein GA0070608_5869 [Micromonospora peucetia]